MNSTDLAFATAIEQAKLLRQKEVSPLELVELYLRRIEQLNPRLGSYFTVAAEMAITDARAKTEYLAGNPADLPPFYGVPISIKDLNPVAGLPCTFGLQVLKQRLAKEDDGVVTKIKQAGFVILGKTATSEVGTLPYTEPRGFAPARNPWNLDYTAGGSSGGAAAAVAAGLCPIAQGSDGGGSVRGPAFCCGLVGIKPSRGRISMAPAGERLTGMATNGSLGRTVADAAALLDVMAGYIPGDPYWLPDPQPSFEAMAGVPPAKLRIAFATNLSPVGEAAPICRQAVLDTAQRLEALGHWVEPDCPNFSELVEPFTIVWQSILAELGIPFFVLGKMNRWLWSRTLVCSTGQYMRAVDKLQRIARQIVAFFEQVDVLLLPTYMHPTIRIGEWANLSSAKTLEAIINWIAPCPPFNASGQPAIALPTGFAPNGLPIGVQLVGRPAAEATLISLAAQLEAVNPFYQNRPPMAEEI